MMWKFSKFTWGQQSSQQVGLYVANLTCQCSCPYTVAVLRFVYESYIHVLSQMPQGLVSKRSSTKSWGWRYNRLFSNSKSINLQVLKLKGLENPLLTYWRSLIYTKHFRPHPLQPIHWASL
jgi:hypothetical protein